MARLLRKLNTKTGWDRSFFPGWVPSDSVPADTLSELNTCENAISLWQLSEDQSNLEMIVAALSATRDHAAAIDYVIVETEQLINLGLEIEQCPGESLDTLANQEWHFDLIRLHGKGLNSLANLIAGTPDGRHRIPKRDVLWAVTRSVMKGRIELNRLSESTRVKVKELIASSETRSQDE